MSTADVRTPSPLLAGFAQHAARSPDAEALTLAGRSYTYAELDETARRWAAAVTEAARGRPQRVGVFGSRSEVSYGGVLAALFAGAAFVPLSPNMPPARTRRMLEAADVDVLLVDEAALPQLAEVLDGVARPAVVLPTADATATVAADMDRRDMERCSPVADLPSVDPGSIAYLLFTSGSTGDPKGVPISHANVGHFLRVALDRYGLTAEDRLSQTFDQVFDLSVFDLFMAWSGGACVCSPRPIDLLSPFRYVEEQHISVWFSVPSLAALLTRKRLLAPGSLPTLRWSLFCGEALRRDTADAWQEAAPASVLENLYGPTEATIACTAYRWDPDRSPDECLDGLVPIGAPFPGLDAVVLGEDLGPVDDGHSGELCVGGPQTFAGYWRDPAATDAAFVTPADGRRRYRTGDRVRTLPTGDVAFVGMVDHQVQVLGHRLELGEVEAVLREAPGVRDAVAVPWRYAAGTSEGVVAFVTGGSPDPDHLAALARTRLPPHAVPRAIRVLDALPLNTNGKIDRPALWRRAEEDAREARA